jgi:hypothetical protein
MQTRRSILSLLGSVSALAAIGGTSSLSGCVSAPDAAEAWRNPGAGEIDPRRFALAHAILAPNPHNRQPWLAKLNGTNALSLYFDTKKLLPATDPFSRQITIGGGTFLEIFALAALRAGYQAEITPFPEGSGPQHLDQRPFASVVLIKGGTVDALYDQILNRRTNREPFDTKREIPIDVRAALANAATKGVASAEIIADTRRDVLRALTDKAYKVEVMTPVAMQESIDLMRIGAREINVHRDGLFLDGPMIEFLAAAGQINKQTLADHNSMAFKTGLTMLEPATRSAMGYLAITTETNTRLDQIDAGRAYARANLTAASLGIAMHPLSQALQEYPEIAKEKAQMDALTNAPPLGRLQMLARIGYAKPIDPAPRRDWRSIMIT